MNKLLIALGIASSLLVINGVVSKTSSASTEEKTIDVTRDRLSDSIQPVATAQTKLVLKELNLSSNRQVFISGVIDETNSPALTKELLELGKTAEPITIVINSPGGSVFDGAAIISAIEAAKGPVNTLCVQLCASMAAMIHSYGTQRLMLNRSVLMFHPASGGVQGTVDQMHSRLALITSFMTKMEQNVSSRSHTTLEKYKARSRVELWLDAEDSVQQGFADQIVFVRGKDAAKLFQDSGEIRNKQQLPTITPNTNQPLVIPVVPKLNWF